MEVKASTCKSGGGRHNSVYKVSMCPEQAGCVCAIVRVRPLPGDGRGRAGASSEHRHELSACVWRTLEKLEITGPGQPGFTLTISSAKTRLHFLENFEARTSPSFLALLCSSPAPVAYCALPGLAAGKREIITKLFCAEGLLTSGWLMLTITVLVTNQSGLGEARLHSWGCCSQLRPRKER